MAWVYLFVAGVFEIVWASGLKLTEGFTKPLPTAVTLLAMVASMGLLGLAAKELPIGTAYAIWTGIGAAGTAVVGMVMFGEAVTAARLLSLALVMVGIVGLKLATPT